MIRDIQKLARHKFDLIVVGGGINGAAIAHMAADNGLSVALLDKGDFASGTSSKSTKLVHGGIRYLENFEFDLVSEALQERYIQFKSAPHLVKPISFLIPVYEGDKRPLWMMKLGVAMYDSLAGKFKLGPHRTFSAKELLAQEPSLNPQGLKGGVLYYDAQMDDARLCLENVLMAAYEGAKVANYVEVLSLMKENSKAVGVVAKDVTTGQIFEIRAKRVVCALGPWMKGAFKDDRRSIKHSVRTTKGIHLVYKGQISKHAVLIQTHQDKRIFFVIPWMGNSLIGTTDTDFDGDPDQVSAEKEDIAYLIEEARRVLPGVDFSEANLVTTFAGLRPLVHKEGEPSEVSRRHEIEVSTSGVIYVMGGKYTTYRKIAQDCLKKFMYLKTKAPLEYTLYGSGPIASSPQEIAAAFSITEESAAHLTGKYGSRYVDVLDLTRKDNSLKQRFCDCSPAIKAEVLYAIEVEMAQNAEDIIERRLALQYIPCASGKCRTFIAETLLKKKV
jgi:glycerol-3-phosphate dehydrogenase